MNTPSEKKLEAAFPGHGKEIKRILKGGAIRQYKSVRDLEAACFNPPGRGQRVMEALNEILEGSGVEHVEHANSDMHGHPSNFEYINMGDTYSTTIIRFECGRYCVSDIGTIIERGNYP